MKNCTKCKYANWKRTASGKLHPSGEGMCGYKYKLPPLPASMSWIREPSPWGGAINRKIDNPTHCTYWAPEGE